MSQHTNLFRDLGRATRRGVRKCPKCGTMTGTRSRTCKNRSCDIVFRDGGYAKKAVTDEGACRIAINSQNCRGFSVRIYHRGPDFRTFVQLPLHQPNTSISSTPSSTAKSLSFGSRCFLNTCSRNKTFPCSHIKAAEKCSRDSQRILIKESVLSTISIPTEAKQVLGGLIGQSPDLVVQRCSSRSFTVNCNPSSGQPLGTSYHMLFFKINSEFGNNEQRFICSCQPMKFRRKDGAQETLPPYDVHNKYCLHYYACVCAFASNDSLATEFDLFLSRAFEVYPATILSQLHMALVPRNNPENSEDALEHPNQISVEIIRENLSLLESIAAVDDPSSESVECALPDHATPTSADDAISFCDSSTLDSLDETDPNCTTHLTHISEILNHSNPIQHAVLPILAHPEIQGPSGSTRINTRTDSITPDGILIFAQHSPSSSSELDSSNSSILQNVHRRKLSKVKRVRTHQNSSPVLESSTTYEIDEEGTNLQSLSFSSIPAENVREDMERMDFERRMILANFERWLASINERMNSAMNYQLPQTCLLVDYVPREIFECLKDRIVSGIKTKRSSNQTTMMVVRKDKPPLGSFRKHVWKIISIIHLLHIFQSSQVPLKLSQFFVRAASGIYCEWTPANDDDEKHHKIHILPVLHCTKLKVGKLDSKEKEVTPFLIEWIPEILPESGTGELCITFQVTHTGPIQTEEERRACNAPIERRIQQSKSFSIT